MFYEAHELFENGSFQKSLELFSQVLNTENDKRLRYWSYIFIGRSLNGLGLTGSLSLYESAHDELPHRAEAMYEIARCHHVEGNLEKAELWLQMAKDANRNVSCIRYESDKYFEKTHELLIDIYLRWGRYNDAEELCYTLNNIGNPQFYNQEKLRYNYLFARHYSNTALEYVKAKAIKIGKELVIELPKGYDGLGDHLVFSHIPRIAKETGKYEKVYVSNHMKYGRPEYKDLVWGLNPWIDGFTDEKGTFVHTIQFNRVLEKWIDLCEGINLMDSIMLLHGLDNDVRDHVPECYYKPEKRKDLEWLSDKTLLDVGSRTISTEFFDTNTFLGMLREQGCSPDFYIVAQGLTNSLRVDSNQTITPKDIYDWCDIMASCKEYVCFNSGGYWLSGALGIKGTHVWIREKNLPAWSYLPHRNVYVDISTISR